MTARPIPTSSAQPRPSEARTSVAAVVVWALCLFAFSIPLEAPHRFAFGVSATTGTVFVLSTLLDPRPSYGRLPWPVAGFFLFLLVLLVAFVMQGAAQPGGLYLAEVLIQALKLALWILLFWACANLLREPRVYRAALWALLLGGLVRVALSLLGLTRITSIEVVERVAAPVQHPHRSAQILALALLALVGLAYLRPPGTRGLRPLSWAGVGLILIGIVQTGSRGALATAAIGALIFLGTGRTLRIRVGHLLLGALLLSVLGFLALRSETMRSRVEQTIGTGRLSGREVTWPTALGMIRDRPVLGWGPVANQRELAARLDDAEHERRDTHNLLLEVLTASGVLGALPFLFATWLCLRAAWNARAGPRGVVPLAMVLAILAANMSQNWLTWPVFWLILSLGLASEDAAGDSPGPHPLPEPPGSTPPTRSSS